MIKGIYTIEKREATFVNGEWVAGPLVETIEEQNNIGPELLYRFHENSQTLQQNMIVCINENNFHDALAAYLHGTYGWITGSRTVGGTYVAGTVDTDPYWYCVTTINPPASVTRNIRTMAISQYQDGIFYDIRGDYVDANSFSIITLDTPCTQTNSQILQITYRLFFDTAAALAYTNTKSYMIDSVARKFFDTEGGYSFQPAHPFWASTKPNELIGVHDGGLTNRADGHFSNNQGSMYFTFPYNINSLNGVRRGAIYGIYGAYNVNTSVDENTGAPVRAVGWGYPYDSAHRHYLWSSLDKGTVSSVQNIFSKTAYSSGTRTPFLTISDISLSPCSVNITDNAGDWVRNIDDPVTPYLYRIQMVTGGIAGTATYKVSRRRIYFTTSNNWQANQGSPIPTLPPYKGAGARGFTLDDAPHMRYGFVTNASTTWMPDWYPIQHSLRGGLCVQTYFYPQFIGFEQNGITVADVNGKWVNFDSTTTPALNATDILQVETDGTTILVACGDTGLWKITRPHNDWTGASTTITKINPAGITNPDSCRGIATKNIGAIVEFKIINGGTGYTAGDTVTVNTENAMGSGFTGTVASVDGNGAITGVTITNAGTGYHRDNVAALVTGTGSGAKLEPLVGANGIWWAIFNDLTDNKCILAWTSNAGSTWTLYDETTATQFLLTNYTSGSPGPTSIIGLHIDSYHADDRLLIQAPSTVHVSTATTSTNGQFFWWSRAGSNPTSNQVRSTNTSYCYALGEKRIGTLCVHALSNNQWHTKGTNVNTAGLWNWGTAAVVGGNTNNTYGTSINTPLRGRVSGQDVILSHNGDAAQVHTVKTPAQLGQSAATFESVVLGNADAVGGTNTRAGSRVLRYYFNAPAVQYLGRGTFLSWSAYYGSSQPYVQAKGWTAYTGTGNGTPTNDATMPYGNWENFGWNGTQWELGHASAKTTHAGSEPLIDGLQISFDDNAGVDQFLVDEYYEAYLFDGILHDNATTFQATYDMYYGASENGTTFTPNIVPAADVGAVVDEPFTVLQEDTWRWYHEPGLMCSRYGSSSFLMVGEQELIGDFEFKWVQSWTHSSQTLRIGVMPWASVVAGTRDSSPMTHNMQIYHDGSQLLTNYTIQSRTSYGAAVAQTTSVTDGAPTDVFSIQRVGTDLFFKRNGVSFRTASTTSTGSLAICFYTTLHTITLSNMTISYDINRRYVDLGNGTTTGKFNPNYGRVNHGTDGVNGLQAVYLDGVPATLLSNSYTPPAAGQVNWMRSRGSLWCNAADAGKVVTGKWVTALKLNFV